MWAQLTRNAGIQPIVRSMDMQRAQVMDMQHARVPHGLTRGTMQHIHVPHAPQSCPS